MILRCPGLAGAEALADAGWGVLYVLQRPPDVISVWCVRASALQVRLPNRAVLHLTRELIDLASGIVICCSRVFLQALYGGAQFVDRVGFAASEGPSPRPCARK